MLSPQQNILNSAQVVFARYGFRQATMAIVAEQAGLTRQALYHHFSSKEALFAALIESIHARAIAAAQAAAAQAAALRSGPDLAKSLSGVIAAYHGEFSAPVAQSPYATELMDEGARQCGSLLAEFAQQLEHLLVTCVKRSVRDGRFHMRPGLSASKLIELILTATKGVKVSFAHRTEEERVRVTEQLVQIICNGAIAADKAIATSQGKRRKVQS